MGAGPVASTFLLLYNMRQLRDSIDEVMLTERTLFDIRMTK